MRMTHHPAHDPTWMEWEAQVQANGGMILSLDGIQPDRGSETVYLVREVLTGRMLAAENVRLSSAAVIKALLAPVVALQVPVLGVISDAQESILQAVAELWPQVPHQICHFHYLREAGRLMFDADRALKVDMRKDLMTKTRVLRNQLERYIAAQRADNPTEVAQLEVLADYALGLQTALNQDGTQPYAYAGLATYDACTEIAHSLAQVEKGAHPSADAVPPNSRGSRQLSRAGSSGRKR
jgi:predicted metal-binding protein